MLLGFYCILLVFLVCILARESANSLWIPQPAASLVSLSASLLLNIQPLSVPDSSSIINLPIIPKQYHVQSLYVTKTLDSEAVHALRSRPLTHTPNLYRSLPQKQRLVNEAFAGALGEIAKDVSLHWVDTLKTRKQARKKGELISNHDQPLEGQEPTNKFQAIKNLYRGFPIVLLSSLPQGAAFFLVKSWLADTIMMYIPDAPSVGVDVVCIASGVMIYWIFRTPAEVIKVRVQTELEPSVAISVDNVIKKKELWNLWGFYSVLLSLDIPFQAINFLLFGLLSDRITDIGVEMNAVTRLVLGITCGMIGAGITCPLDVGRTRVISRLKESNKDVNQDNEQEAIINRNKNVFIEIIRIAEEEGLSSLFLGLQQRLLYTGMANGIRLSVYGTCRMYLMMKVMENL